MGNCWGPPVDDVGLSSFNPGIHDTSIPGVTVRRPPSPVSIPGYGGGGGSTGRRGDRPREAPDSGTGGEKGGSGPAPATAAAAVEGVDGRLKVFTLEELRSATRNFRPDSVLGEGGFGKVFKGWVEQKTYAPSRPGVGIPVAVKKSNPDSSQGLQEWQAEVRFLGKFSHPNLVKLLGYCWDNRQFLLVYEYMKNRSLEHQLFSKGVEPLTWNLRLQIAIGAARGLAFLHNSEKSVIYRDFKTSNILLDSDFNAKLSDFGLAKLGPTDGRSHITTQVLGTYGYAAPEYIATGHLYIKSDVYGFGVVLLELLTGLPALDQNRPSGSHSLVDWAKPSLSEKRKLKKIVDPRLEGRYPSKAVVLVAELILRCLESDRRKRPSMQEVLYALEKINLTKEKLREAGPRPTHHVDHGHRSQMINRPSGSGSRGYIHHNW
ncbi:hypothetical protein SAY87_004045 [Trapa incisa]|uniref:non-specific serine/threonine protein kinase n=1 Tax=Trapa incisa TaxID=236973 RepID=A0AAN7JQD0_9MYRT|nr:hypothetical protein SAY87_004045 [Trapa incisa]